MGETLPPGGCWRQQHLAISLKLKEWKWTLLSTAPWCPLSGRCWWSWTSCCLGANCPEPASWSRIRNRHTHTPTCEVHRFDLSCLFIPQKDQTDRGGVRLTLRTSVGLARQEDMTPDTTPQNTLMTIVSSVQTTAADQHRFPQTDQLRDNQVRLSGSG